MTARKASVKSPLDPILQQAVQVLRTEGESILGLIDRLDGEFVQAVETIAKAKGRVIVTGIGKSGLIGKKIVATLTSTGTPALFLHPVEGLHGDLGIVTKGDVAIAISNSGETHELNIILDSIRGIGARIIAFTGNRASTLARLSDIVIDVGVAREACPFGLAPTSSSTATLAMGDALAVALIEKRSFKEKDFYKFHPGGSLGSRLRERVRDAAIRPPHIPRVFTGVSVMAALDEMDNQNKGFVLVTDRRDKLLGIITDGDVRRLAHRGRPFQDEPVNAVMTRRPKTIGEEVSLAEALERMQKDEITSFAVVDGKGRLTGYVHLHDILGRGGTLRMSGV